MLNNKISMQCVYLWNTRGIFTYLFVYLQGNPVNSCGFAFVFCFHHWKHFLHECVLSIFVGFFETVFHRDLWWWCCSHGLDARTSRVQFAACLSKRDLGFLQVRGEGTSLSLMCSSGEGVLTVYFCVHSFALDFSFPEQSRHFSPAWPYEEVVYGCQWCVGKCHTQTGRCQWRAVFAGELALKASPLSHGPSCPVPLHISPLALPSCQRRAHLGKAALIRRS